MGVTLATSYAFGDVFGLKHSLHRGFADAKQFYLSYTAMVAELQRSCCSPAHRWG